jgi:hypothetical protein
VHVEASRRLDLYCVEVRRYGLESGADFLGLHDRPHAQDPAWKTYPVVA